MAELPLPVDDAAIARAYFEFTDRYRLQVDNARDTLKMVRHFGGLLCRKHSGSVVLVDGRAIVCAGGSNRPDVMPVTHLDAPPMDFLGTLDAAGELLRMEKGQIDGFVTEVISKTEDAMRAFPAPAAAVYLRGTAHMVLECSREEAEAAVNVVMTGDPRPETFDQFARGICRWIARRRGEPESEPFTKFDGLMDEGPRPGPGFGRPGGSRHDLG